MISAGSSELTQKWVDVLHNQSEDYIIPESDVNVMCPYDCLDMSSSAYVVNNGATFDYCTPSALKNAPTTINRNKKIATFEWNFWVLDGSFEVLDTGEKFNGFMSNTVSRVDCTFASSPYAYINRTDGNTFALNKNQTIKFNPMANEFPAILNITTRYTNAQDQIVVTNNIDFDIESSLLNDDLTNQEYVHLFSNDVDTSNVNTQVMITFTRTIMPYRRVRISEYNNGYKFFKNKYDMQSFTHSRSASLTMEELPQNTSQLDFVDELGVFDSENISAPFHIVFNNNHRFYTYYGYNFDDIGWNYVLLDTQVYDAIEIDRGGYTTSLNLKGLLTTYTQKYSSDKLNYDPVGNPKSSPFNWTSFRGFITAIKHSSVANIPSITIDSNAPDYIDSGTGNPYNFWYWQYFMWLSCKRNVDSNFSTTPANELLQQICALLKSLMVINPDGSLFIKNIGTFSTTEVDTIDSAMVISYPSFTQESSYGKIFVETPSIFAEQSSDETTSQEIQNVGTQTYYQTSYGFLMNSSLTEEQTLTQNIVPLAIKNKPNTTNPDTTGWFGWQNGYPAYNLFRSYAIWYNNIHRQKVMELGECLFNPLLQVGDTLKVSIGDEYKSYKGCINKIELNYDGSFKGTVSINII